MTRRPPGAGSVTRTPHGTWRVRVHDATGKRRCVGTYADETEARRADPPGKPVLPAPPVPRQSHGVAVEVLILAARGDTLPAELLTDLARAAIVAGVRGDLALALLDGAGEHAARIAVDLAAAACDAQTRARETGT